MKKLLSIITMFLMGSAVYAQVPDYAMMRRSGMGMWSAGMGLVSLLYFAIASLIFSLIFWLVYKWLVKGKE